jgi:hypothetical protein
VVSQLFPSSAVLSVFNPHTLFPLPPLCLAPPLQFLLVRRREHLEAPRARYGSAAVSPARAKRMQQLAEPSRRRDSCRSAASAPSRRSSPSRERWPRRVPLDAASARLAGEGCRVVVFLLFIGVVVADCGLLR